MYPGLLRVSSHVGIDVHSVNFILYEFGTSPYGALHSDIIISFSPRDR